MKKSKLTKQKNTSNNTVLCPVIFGGRKFFGIIDFDCICISLFTEETLQGTFSILVPISSLEYRLINTTQAKVEIETKEDWTIFKISSDWGSVYTMEIHNSLSKEIEYAKQKAIEYKLLHTFA